MLAFLTSGWVTYADRRWKQNIEAKRPFDAELHKLSALVTKHEIQKLRVDSLSNRLSQWLDETEKMVGRTTAVDQWQGIIKDLGKQRDQIAEIVTSAKHLHEVGLQQQRPSPKEFAVVTASVTDLTNQLEIAVFIEQQFRDALDKTRGKPPSAS